MKLLGGTILWEKPLLNNDLLCNVKLILTRNMLIPLDEVFMAPQMILSLTCTEFDFLATRQ